MTFIKSSSLEQKTSIASTDADLTVTEVKKKLGISGLTRVKKTVKKMSTRKDRTATNSFAIDKFIYENYPEGTEFTTAELSEYFRSIDWKTSEISGQMHGKKQAGLLTNRKPTDVESDFIGRGTSIWKATSVFYQKLRDELEPELNQTREESTDIEVRDQPDMSYKNLEKVTTTNQDV